MNIYAVDTMVLFKHCTLFVNGSDNIKQAEADMRKQVDEVGERFRSALTTVNSTIELAPGVKAAAEQTARQLQQEMMIMDKEFREELRKMDAELMSAVTEAIEPLVNSTASKLGADVVIPANHAMYVSAGADMTSEVLESMKEAGIYVEQAAS